MKSLIFLFSILFCCSCAVLRVQNGNQVAQVPWPHSNSTVDRCEILEKHSSSGDLPERELTIVDLQGHHTTVFRTLDSLIAVYPIGEEDALLISVWVGGSAYKIRAISLEGGAPTIVLDAGSKSFPETIDRAAGGLWILLGDVSGDPGLTQNWKSSRYGWDGNKMSKLDEVPFSSRFEKLP
jgi:hypothetical protein